MSTTFVRSFALCLVLVASGCASTYTADRVRGLSADRFGTLELANPVHSGILIAKIDGGVISPATGTLVGTETAPILDVAMAWDGTSYVVAWTTEQAKPTT